MPIPAGGDNKRNLCSSNVEEVGDVDAMLEKCAYTVDQVYHTKANQQTMMETFRTYCYMDHFQRLTVVSSTQIPFHIRRIVGNALKQGQQKPTAKQKEKQDKAQDKSLKADKPKKSKGMKM